MIRCLFFVFCVAVGLQSCRLVGLNFKHVPPKKTGTYKNFTRTDSLKGYYGPLRQNNDVTYYSLYINPDAKTKTISGKSEIHFTVLTDMELMQLDLHERMDINTITMDGKMLAYRREKTSFFVHFPQPLAKGEKKIIEVTFSGKPQAARKPPWEGGIVWKQDKDKNPWIGVACEYDGAGLWWPLKDHIADEPDSVDISIEAPSGLSAIANGTLRSVTAKQNSNVYNWHCSYNINPYNITFYTGNFVHFSLPCPSCSIDTLSFYVLRPNLEKARQHFRQTPRIIRTYEEGFGPYPWPKDGFKLVESPFEGMEHQSAIAYGNGYKNMYLGVDYIILHETAHEWWGNSISVADFADVWLHEGFATYCEFMFVEKIYGRNEADNYAAFESATIRNKFPVVGPRSVHYWNYKDGDPYTKGSITLQTLRSTLRDDKLFFDILKTFYQQHARSTVNTQMFIDHVNTMTGKDYSWFFNQYLHSAQIPVLEWYYKTNADDRSVSLFYRWARTNNDFVMPIDIEIDGKNELLYPVTNEFREYKYRPEQKLWFPSVNFYYYLKHIKAPRS